MATVPKKKPNLAKLTDGVTVQPKTGFKGEWDATKDLFCDTLGLTESQLDNIHIEALRCKGNDFKERLFMRRIFRTESLFQDEGYYLEFFSASHPTRALIGVIGPFDDEAHSAEAYDCIVRFYKFSPELLITKPDNHDDLFEALDDDDLFEGLDDDDDDLFEGLDDDDDLFDIDEDEDEGLWD